jgi:WD40 repeat protein
MRRAISFILPPTLLIIAFLLAACGGIFGPEPTLVPFPTPNLTPSPIIIRVPARIPTRTPSPTATAPAGVALSAQAITPENVGGLQTLRSEPISRSAILAADFAPVDRRVATFGFDKVIRIFDGNTLEVIHELPGHGEYGAGLGWSPDGRRLASAGRFAAKVWDAQTGALLSTTPIQTWGDRLAWHPGGQRFAVAGRDYSRIEIISAEGGKLDDAPTGGYVLMSVAYSTNGLLLAAGDQARQIHLLNGESLTPIFTVQASSVPLDIEFSPNDQLMAACESGGLVEIWNVGTLVLSATTRVDPANCLDGAFAPTGVVYFAATEAGSLVALDPRTGGQLAALPLGSPIWSASVSADGALLALAMDDWTLRILGVP